MYQRAVSDRPRVAGLVVEQRLAAQPEALVGVHAGAVVTEQRLGHERRRLAVLPGGVLDDVLEQLHLVAGVQQGRELVVDLGLARGADLVVRTLDGEAGVDQPADHRVAQVGVVVERRDGEVTALVRGLVAAVAALLVLARVPGALDRVDVVEGLVGGGRVADRVEDVELGLGAEVGRVGDAAGRQVGLGLLRHVPRVARVGLAGERVVDEEVQRQRLLGPERVDEGRGDVRQQHHVGLVDGLEPADRRAVEGEAVGDHAVVERLDRGVEVLHHARKVTEPDVDELDVLVLEVSQKFLGIGEHTSSWQQNFLSAACGRRVARLVATLWRPGCPGVSLLFPPCYGRCEASATSARLSRTARSMGPARPKRARLRWTSWQHACRTGRPRPGSTAAGFGRRFAALLIDWALCTGRRRACSSATCGPTRGRNWCVFVLVHAFFVGLFGQTPGMALLRSAVSPSRTVARSASRARSSGRCCWPWSSPR